MPRIVNLLGIDIIYHGEVIRASGLARVQKNGCEFQPLNLSFVAGLPAQKEGIIYLVSVYVLAAALRSGRSDCVAPASFIEFGAVSPCPEVSAFFSF